MRHIIPVALTLFFGAALETAGAQTPIPVEPIRLGFIAPLTGPFPQWGESIRRGLEIALLDTRHRFSVDYQDDACQAKQAIGVAQRFFSVDKIKYIIGPGCDHTLLAIAPIAAKADALLFSTGLLGEDVFTHHPNVLNFATQISQEAKRIIRQIAQQKVKKLAIVHGTNTFGEEYNTRLREEFAKTGGESYSESTDLGTTDFQTIISKVLARAPQAIFIHQGNSETIAFLRQLRTKNPTIPAFGVYSVENESFIEAGRATEGITYAYPLNSASSSEPKQRFDRRFVEKFGPTAIPFATSYYVYDGLMVLDKAFDSCAPTDSKCVSKFFRSFGKYAGISGEMYFRPDGGTDRTYGIKQVKDGKFVWISEEA